MDANQLSDALGLYPLYKHKEKARWSSAHHLYRMMNEGTAEEGQATPSLPLGFRVASTGHSLLSPEIVGFPLSLPGSRPGGLFSSGNSPPNRNGSWVINCTSPPGDVYMNSLELEAVAAVNELPYAVTQIDVSDMLPRTPDLIFVNVTTLEGMAYCLELTTKGWRVASLRHDCMNGDISHMDLHVRYFENVYAVMDEISAGYREKFSETLAAKLRQVAVSRRQEALFELPPMDTDECDIEAFPRTPASSPTPPDAQANQSGIPSVSLQRSDNGD